MRSANLQEARPIWRVPKNFGTISSGFVGIFVIHNSFVELIGKPDFDS